MIWFLLSVQGIEVEDDFGYLLNYSNNEICSTNELFKESSL